MINNLMVSGRYTVTLLLATVGVSNVAAQDIVLEGTVTSVDHQTYIAQPFTVPEGVTSITVSFDYDRADKTVIDLGVADPNGIRGWSGGNKASFTIGATEATLSYLPGAIEAGSWSLILGVPNARAGASADWKAEIFFRRADEIADGFADAPLRTGPQWYRGDLHSHTAHSDGSCAAQSGERAPCPLYRSIEAAAARSLDFLAITEHNTTSHFSEMRGLQPAFDELLLVPGREITTFYGHANLLGPTTPLDFRLGSESVPAIDTLLKAARGIGGFVSINHPGLPSGEACMGCGWTALDTDWSLVGAVEVVNGGAVAAAGGSIESPLSGIPFWHARLNEGHRLTAIGGSDNHDALLTASDPRAIGGVVTAIWAEELSVPALMEGLRQGRAFVDVTGSTERTLDFEARVDGNTVRMGDKQILSQQEQVDFSVTLESCEGCLIEVVRNGASIPDINGTAREFTIPIKLAWEWLRINVRDSQGRLLMLGNPIYFQIGERD